MMLRRSLENPDEEPEPIRIPEERGQLVPPSRRPPTAIGTATPRPDHRPGPPIPQKVSRLTRIARSMFGTGLMVGGIALATLPPLGAVLGLGVALLGVDVMARAVADRGLLAVWRSRRRRIDSVASDQKGEHVRRSA